MIAIAKRNFNNKKPTSLRKDGLVAAYNMIPAEGNILKDISGNGNDGTIVEMYSTKEGLYNPISDQGGTVDFANTILDTNIWGINFILNKYEVGNLFDSIFSGVSNKFIRITELQDKIAFYDSTNTTFRWDVFSTVIAKNRNVISFTADGTNIHLWINGVNYGFITPVDTTIYVNTLFGRSGRYKPKCEIQYLEFYNKILSEKEIKDFNNKFASQVYFKDDFKYDNYGEAPKGWQVGSGEFKVVKDENKKVLECVSPGIIGFQNKQINGRYKFNFKKSGSGNLLVYFISNSKNLIDGDMGLLIYSNGSFILNRRAQVNLFITDTAIFQINANYEIIIDVTVEGKYSCYIKGGDYKEFTLIPVTSGSNPVIDTPRNSSEFFNIQVTSSPEQISNIVLKKGIEV